MSKLIFRLVLTVNSLMLLVVVYLVKGHYWIHQLGKYTILLYIGIPVILSGICLRIAGWLSKDSIEGDIKEIEMANDSYMSVYLGYFFVALSIPDHDIMTLALVFGIVFLLTFSSQTQYYNPLFLLFGYKFYYLTKKNSMKIFLITKQEIRRTENLVFQNLRRINDFTFIDKGE